MTTDARSTSIRFDPKPIFGKIRARVTVAGEADKKHRKTT